MQNDEFPHIFRDNMIKKTLPFAGVSLINRLALAPLAGTTETVFRSLCSEMGAAFVTTELVSARGICHDPELKKNFSYLEIQPSREPRVAIQLFGHDPRDFARAAQIILEHPLLCQCLMLDINMGCPVKKVVREGSGSALMKTPALAAEIVKAVSLVASDFQKPVSVKIRAGWDEQSINAPDFAETLARAGASLITVHARTREQMYAGKADWSVIRKVKQVVDVPVFGNGDLTDFASLYQMYEQTGCDGFAIGRAAQGNPFIFREILMGEEFKPDKAEWLDLIEQHIDGIRMREKTEKTAIVKMRSQFAAYLKGKRNAAFLRDQIMHCTSKAEVMAVFRSAEFC